MKKYNIKDHSNGVRDIEALHNSDLSRWDMARIISHANSLLKIIDFKLMNHELNQNLAHYLIKSYFKDNGLQEFNHGRE